jgi:hypothetical protein
MDDTKRTFCSKTSWNGRESYTLSNGTIRVVTLTGGGHIAELRFDDSTGFPSVSPLWVPHWQTIEPYEYRPKIHTPLYGTLTEGKLLSGIVGHNVCLDYFGSPSPEEAKQGLSQHGEAPNSKWKKTGVRVEREKIVLTLSVRLPVAGLQFHREIKVRKGESILYFKETVVNEAKSDHFFHWTQHVTLGPPFLSHVNCRISIPATRGKTFPHRYDEGKDLLKPGRDFRWPMAPAQNGGLIDLNQTLVRRGLGFVVGMLLDPRRQFQFVAACNKKMRLLVGYCFQREDFPFVAVWEENRAISGVPWKRRTETRGIEFGSNPLPLTRREAFSIGSFFGYPVFTCVPARGRLTTRYLAFLSSIPAGFGELRDVESGQDQILLYGTRRKDPLSLEASDLRDVSDRKDI